MFKKEKKKILDPPHDPDQHQTLIGSSLGHVHKYRQKHEWIH